MPEPTLIAYRIHKYPSMPIVPAPSQRQWMNATQDRFANRCLPLLIANQNGWFILNAHRISAIWNGGPRQEDVTIQCLAGPKEMPCPAVSHFGHGVLTWNLNYLFRTPPDYNLWARGPTNMAKDGIIALDGIIETDWSVATFTMNWKFTRPHQPIEFRPGEPICMILPIRRSEVEQFQPMVRDIDTEPELAKAFAEWAKSREQFIKDLHIPQSEAQQAKWQKDYVQGVGPTGITASRHQVKLEVREFELPQPPTKPA